MFDSAEWFYPNGLPVVMQFELEQVVSWVLYNFRNVSGSNKLLCSRRILYTYQRQRLSDASAGDAESRPLLSPPLTKR